MSISFEELLARDGVLVYRTRGRSMEPMLRQNRDLVVIETPSYRLKPMDTALYKKHGAYVLHRVIEVRDGYYLIRGDNTFVTEKVPDSDVIGVLTGFQRKGKQFSTDDRTYRLYVRFWIAVYPLRLFFFRFRRLSVKILRNAGILPLLKKIFRKGEPEK